MAEQAKKQQDEGEERPALAPVPDPDELSLDASGQLSFAVGGRKPDGASLRLVGGKIDLEGDFAKGEKVTLRVDVEVGEVAFIDKKDPQTGTVIACERRHKARIIGVGRL